MAELQPDDRLPSIAVYVCTHRRNEGLRRAIDSIVASAGRAGRRVRCGIVVIDDNPDGAARPVVDAYPADTLPLGISYVPSGAQNISRARNLGLTSCMERADWVGMIDDDETVDVEWLEQLFAVQERTGADAVTGPVYVEYAAAAPRWLTSQRIGQLFEAPQVADGSAVEHASTGNSMVSTAWLRAHPGHRFRDDLGTSGGEDMVFYRSAIGAGLRTHYALHAAAREVAPPERSTLAYVLRRSHWMGNTTAVTNLETAATSRHRLLAKSAKTAALALVHPIRRLVRMRAPELRRTLAHLAYSGGIVSGVVGRRLRHS